jgi:hypothetical protein
MSCTTILLMVDRMPVGVCTSIRYHSNRRTVPRERAAVESLFDKLTCSDRRLSVVVALA